MALVASGGALMMLGGVAAGCAYDFDAAFEGSSASTSTAGSASTSTSTAGSTSASASGSTSTSTSTSSGSGGGGGGESCTNAVDDDRDGLIDCADDDCAAYACEAPPPAGWSGPAEVFFGDGSMPLPVCDAAWPTSSEVHEGLIAPPPQCSACECDPPANAACSLPATQIWGGGQCAGGMLLLTPAAPNTCAPTPPLGGADSARGLAVMAIGGDCVPTGGAPTGAPWTETGPVLVCAGATPGAGCGAAGDLCLPAARGAGWARCIRQAGDQPCPSGVYASKHTTHASVSDTRSCAQCACGPAAGITCTGETFIFSGSGCQILDVVVPNDGSCTQANGFDQNGSFLYAPTGGPSGGSCPPGGGEPTGAVVAEGVETLCCAG